MINLWNKWVGIKLINKKRKIENAKRIILKQHYNCSGNISNVHFEQNIPAGWLVTSHRHYLAFGLKLESWKYGANIIDFHYYLILNLISLTQYPFKVEDITFTSYNLPSRWQSRASTRRWWSTWRSRGRATWPPSPWWISQWRSCPCSTGCPAAQASPSGGCPLPPEAITDQSSVTIHPPTNELTSAKLLIRIMAITAVSKYLFSISLNVLILRLAQPCQKGESSSPARHGKLR